MKRHLKPGEQIVFCNATVLPMDREALTHHDVVAQDGRITALVPTQGPDAYPDAVCVDCTGRFLMPGLWDMHVHLFNDEFLDYTLSWGVTSVLNMWGFDKHLKWRRELEQGRRIGPDLFSTGPIIDSLPTYPLITVAATPEQARQAVLDAKAAGFDFVKLYNNLTPEVYAEVEKTAAEVGIDVIGHLPNCANSDYTGRREDYAIRQKTIEHILFVNDDNLDKIVAQGVWLDPTFIVEQVFRDGPDPAAQSAADSLRPMIRTVYWRALGGQHKQPREGAQKSVRKELSYYDDIFRRFLQKGGKVLIGTDSGFPNVIPGYALHQELAACVAHGMSPADALRAATLDAAGFMGKAELGGSVTPGKNADLLVLTRDPRADIGATLDIHALLKRDRLFDSAGLESVRRRAKRRLPFAVESVFHSYMWRSLGQVGRMLFPRRAKAPSAK